MDTFNSDGRSTSEPGKLVEVGCGAAYARTGVGSLGPGSGWGGGGGSAWPGAVDFICFRVHAPPAGRDTQVCGHTGACPPVDTRIWVNADA